MKPVKKHPRRGLTYVGPEYLSGIPARDLSTADIERLARDPYVKRRIAPNASALADVLTSSGMYRSTKEN